MPSFWQTIQVTFQPAGLSMGTQLHYKNKYEVAVHFAAVLKCAWRMCCTCS